MDTPHPNFTHSAAEEVAHLAGDPQWPLAIRDLLAVLNGDGGQHQHAVGVEQAARDALEEVHRLRQTLAEQIGAPASVLEGALALIEQHVPYPAAAAQDLRRLLGKEASQACIEKELQHPVPARAGARVFARIFYAEDVGQVLAILDADDRGPVVRISFQPEGMGVCSVQLHFRGTDAGETQAERLFAAPEIEERALATARRTLQLMQDSALLDAAEQGAPRG